jgi:hypothetical protein
LSSEAKTEVLRRRERQKQGRVDRLRVLATLVEENSTERLVELGVLPVWYAYGLTREQHGLLSLFDCKFCGDLMRLKRVRVLKATELWPVGLSYVFVHRCPWGRWERHTITIFKEKKRKFRQHLARRREVRERHRDQAAWEEMLRRENLEELGGLLLDVTRRVGWEV